MSDDQTSPFQPAPPPSTQPTFDPIAPPPTPVPVTPVAKPSRAARGGTALNGLLVVASLVAVGGIAFGIGRATAASTTAATTGRFGNGQGQLGAGNGGGANPGGSFAPGRGQFGGGFGGFGAAISLQGTVVSVTPETLTLKTTNGQTVEIPLATSTTYGTETASDAAAVTTGANVVVQLQGGGRGAFGGNGGNGGNGGSGGNGPGASPAPGSSVAPGGGRGFTLGPAVSVTVVP